MPDLTDLLARWHETAPDECVRYDNGVCIIRKEKDEHGDADSAFQLYPEYGPCEWALILGAVVYHAARRGLSLRLMVGHDVHEYRARAVVFHSEARTPTDQFDGAGGLRALVSSALSAYLDAISNA